MAFFTYNARDSDGNDASGLVEAPSSDGAVRLLRTRQLFVISIKETREKHDMSSLMAKFHKVGFSDVVNFTRQLATMIVAGLSLPEALRILQNQTTNAAFTRIIVEVEHQIVGGGNLADSLGKYPNVFNPIYLALVRAGESSGTLDKVLERLAETLESQAEFRSKVKGAMIYPVIIVIGMFAVVMVMMTVVVPKLTDLYRDFGIDLPGPTKILIATSDFFVHFWWFMIALIVVSFITFVKWRKTPIGELMVDSFILRLPLFGDLTKKVLLVEFTRTLAMLISSGIHILQGLKTLRNSLGNVRFRNAIDEISKKVEKGFPLGDTFSQHDEFPPIVSQMMKVGEETGKLDDTLVKLSRYFESESEHLVRGLTTAIEPIIMVVLGVGVGFIVISIITPIYNLTSQFK